MTWPQYSNTIIQGVSDILKSGKVNYWTGKYGRLFEEQFAKYMGLNYCVAVNSGSMALELAITALDLPPQSEIIVPARSYIATANAVLRCGHTPVFADLDYNSNINVHTVHMFMTKKTKAIIVVHIGGVPVDVELLKQHNLPIIEDCAQAHGSRLNDKTVGTFGDIATWSFCNDKAISTLGEGGMVGTNNQKYFHKIWSLKDVGRDFIKSYEIPKEPGYRWLHDHIGTNARMTEIQAFAGLCQLDQLDTFIEMRSENVERYKRILKDTDIKFPSLPSNSIASYWKLNCHSRQRDQLIQNCNFITTGSCSEMYKEKVFKKQESLTYARYFSRYAFTLLIDPTILESQIDNNGEKILECLIY